MRYVIAVEQLSSGDEYVLGGFDAYRPNSHALCQELIIKAVHKIARNSYGPPLSKKAVFEECVAYSASYGIKHSVVEVEIV